MEVSDLVILSRNDCC